MKKSSLLAASVAAASATAVSASGSVSNSTIQFSREKKTSTKNAENCESQKSDSSEKFAPRFDGLRFIETLVTGHR